MSDFHAAHQTWVKGSAKTNSLYQKVKWVITKASYETGEEFPFSLRMQDEGMSYVDTHLTLQTASI